MDIKGGYSTANADWPYFQILDQIVPLMRKEKIEKLSPSIDEKELDSHKSLPTVPSPLTTPLPDPEPEPLTMPGIQETTTTSGTDNTKTESAEATSEPPRKRGRSRRAAQRARDRWWGAVEDSDLGMDTATGSGGPRSELSSQLPHKAPSVDSLEPSQMELQTFNMLETCSTALTEIRDILKEHTERQEKFMQSLQQTIASQDSMTTELLGTVSAQNATLIGLISQLTTSTNASTTTITTPGKGSMQHPPLVVSAGSGNYPEGSLQPHSHSQQEQQQQQQLLSSQQSLMRALTQRQQQQCDDPMVGSPELTTGL